MPILLSLADHPYWFTLPSLLVFAHKNYGHKKSQIKDRDLVNLSWKSLL
jgi:hypothetical protein